MSTYVVVGGGLAGAKAVETLRAEGFDGAIVLVAAEAELPYDRPPLSKGLLQGTAERASVFVHEAGWYAEHDVDLRLATRAESLDPAEHRLLLDDGSELHYDKLLLATGSAPRRLDLPGADGEHVHYLRDLEQSEQLRGALAAGGPVVIIGAGWIGLEVAAAARAAGVDVTVVEAAPKALGRVLGDEVADVFAAAAPRARSGPPARHRRLRDPPRRGRDEHGRRAPCRGRPRRESAQVR